jgi:hypothetical protein
MSLYNDFLARGYIGLIKFKGDAPAISPERFSQLRSVAFSPWLICKKDIIGYCIQNGIYWVLCKEAEGVYAKVPFAKNLNWWKALTSEIEYAHIRTLPQIFITGTA